MAALPFWHATIIFTHRGSATVIWVEQLLIILSSTKLHCIAYQLPNMNYTELGMTVEIELNGKIHLKHYIHLKGRTRPKLLL